MTKALYVDSELLENKIKESGYKIDFIVDSLGISRQGFAKKRKGAIPFRASEIYVLCDKLKIADDERSKIFCPKGTQEIKP